MALVLGSIQSSTSNTPIADELTGADACFSCLGVSAAGRDAADYEPITSTYTLAAAHVVAAGNPDLTFVYVSGEGTDSTEQGRSAWARVKGRTENALLAMDMHPYSFRPPMDPAHPRRDVEHALVPRDVRLTSWLYPVIRRVAPRYVTSTEQVGRAMLATTRLHGADPHVLRTTQINRLAA
ncbi:epimerase [Streptomyces sp. NPDC088553]|uniref:epimerase n=1 Tax=Streptomyces sp. NPDC088553 TaxID=3365864 RepID=UPI0038075E0F